MSDIHYTNQSFALNSVHYEGYEAKTDDYHYHFDSVDWIKEHVAKRNVQAIVVSSYTLSLEPLREYVAAANGLPFRVLFGQSITPSNWNLADDLYASLRESTNISKVILSEITCKLQGDAHADAVSKRAMGVYHPKFIMIFCEEGLAVAVSTNNVSGSTSIEGTWSQFFPTVDRDNTNNDKINVDVDADADDFGLHLENFLVQCGVQMKQTGDRGLSTWLEYYTKTRLVPLPSCSPLNKEKKKKKEKEKLNIGDREIYSLQRKYDFTGAYVRLVSVVPGRFFRQQDPQFPFTTDNCKCLQTLSCCEAYPEGVLYGARRIAQVLDQEVVPDTGTGTDTDRQDHEVHDPSSIFHIFMTSIGANLTREYIIAELLPMYLGKDFHQSRDLLTLENDNDNDHSERLLDIMRIFWPEEGRLIDALPQRRTVVEVTDTSGTKLFNEAAGRSMSYMTVNGMVEMHFAHRCFRIYQSIAEEADNQSQQQEEETSLHKILKHTPHIKLYCRESQKENESAQCKCQPLQWCLLTSSCLSHGAQGKKGPPVCKSDRCALHEPNHDAVLDFYDEFKNFELGVLFISDTSGTSGSMSKSKSGDDGEGDTSVDTKDKDKDKAALPRQYYALNGGCAVHSACAGGQTEAAHVRPSSSSSNILDSESCLDLDLEQNKQKSFSDDDGLNDAYGTGTEPDCDDQDDLPRPPRVHCDIILPFPFSLNSPAFAEKEMGEIEPEELLHFSYIPAFHDENLGFALEKAKTMLTFTGDRARDAVKRHLDHDRYLSEVDKRMKIQADEAENATQSQQSQSEQCLLPNNIIHTQIQNNIYIDVNGRQHHVDNDVDDNDVEDTKNDNETETDEIRV